MLAMISMPAFLEATARATIILAATGLVATALRRSSASARHVVWVLGLVSALLVPVLSLALPKVELPIVQIASRRVPVDLSVPIVGNVQPARNLPAIGSHPAAEDPRTDAVSSVRRQGQGAAGITGAAPLSATTILFLIWAVGAALVLGRMLLGLAAVQLMTRRTQTPGDESWLALGHDLADRLGLRRVRFLQSTSASMPMAWGLLRGSVLMPADAGTWPAHRLRVVLLHELAHVKRRDCLTHLVAQTVCAAYWFNPLAWIAVRRLRSERERACDDLVLQTGTRGSDYADELLDIARAMQRQRFPAVLAGATLAMAHRSQLEGRLIAILDPSVPRRGLSRTRLAAAAAVFAALILPIASVQPWAVEAASVAAPVNDARLPQADPDAARAHGSAAARQEVKVETHVQTGTTDKSRAIARDVADGVADQVGGVVSGVVGGVVEGVVGGVTGGVISGVTASVPAGVEQAVAQAVEHAAQANPNPNPNPSGQQKRQMDPRAAAALMDALKDSDKEVRETAMQALVQLRDPRMFEPLVTALKDASPDVREQAVFGLGQLRDPRAIEPLMSVLHDSNADVRQQAIFALGQFRDKRALEPMISALKDENGDVREQAAFGLGQLRDPRAVEALVIALKDAKPDVREQAAFALGQIRDARAVDGLTAALKDGNADVRKQAAFALGQIRY